MITHVYLIDARGSAGSEAITLMPSIGAWQNMPPCSRMMGWDSKVGMTRSTNATAWVQETWVLGFWDESTLQIQVAALNAHRVQFGG